MASDKMGVYTDSVMCCYVCKITAYLGEGYSCFGIRIKNQGRVVEAQGSEENNNNNNNNNNNG